MKRIIILSFIMIFVLTGCGAGVTETLSCSYDAINGNISTSTVYNVDYQDKEVKKVRVTYKYHQNNPVTYDENTDENTDEIDGVGTGTDGTTNDTQMDNDGIIDGAVGSAIDSVINGVTSVILDIAGIRDRHMNVQNMYGNINGFSVQNIDDMSDNDYTVTYIIDYDNISDDDLATLNLSRDIDTIRSNYLAQGFTCR